MFLSTLRRGVPRAAAAAAATSNAFSFRSLSTSLRSPAQLSPPQLIKVLDEISLNMTDAKTMKEVESVAKTISDDAKRQQFVFDEVIKLQHDTWLKHGLDPKTGFDLLHSDEGWEQVESAQADEATKQALVQKLIEFDTVEERLVMTAAHGEEEYKNQFERRLIIQEIFEELGKLEAEEAKLEYLDRTIAEAHALFKERLGGFTEEEIEAKFETVLTFEEQRLIMRGQLCREIQDSAMAEEHQHGHSHNGVPCSGHHHHAEEEEEEPVHDIPREEKTGKPVWKKSNQ